MTEATPTRRCLFGAAAAIVAGLTATGAGVTSRAAANPDADLVALCAQHIANQIAYNASAFEEDTPEDDALWEEYSRTRDLVSAAVPKTLEGVLAKARAAKADAADINGDDTQGAMGGMWAWDIVNDLVRIGGSAVA